MEVTFEDLNLNTALLNALNDLGYSTPTPIQHKAFPVIMSGRDVIGLAQTGTGKTFAYLLPILRQLTFSEQKAPRVLIIVPTRELVLQVVAAIRQLIPYMRVRVEGVYGGTNINTQKELVINGLDILVGTPGRLMDLALSRILLLKSIRTLVIDEVDELFSLGFRPQLTTIFDLLPERRQNLLFSATFSEELDDMIEQFFNGPVFLELTRAGTPLEKIAQIAYEAPNFYSKMNLLIHLLENDSEMKKVLIFGATKRMADQIYEILEEKFPGQFNLVHGNKSQNFRINAVSAFEKGLLKGLITTDLLARGLDVSDITHVINVDTPTDPQNYIHRIGRTGRADNIGAACTFVAPSESEFMAQIEDFMKKPIARMPFPEDVTKSDELTIEELPAPTGKNIQRLGFRDAPTGAFHDKKDKNKKINLGNKAKYMRDKKYKKPIKKSAKKK